MARRMSGAFVRAQLEKSLEILASPAKDQQDYVERMGLGRSVDELALGLDDFIVMLPAAVNDGEVSEDQAAAIRRVSDLTASFSGKENAALWRTEQLDSAPQWKEVRRLARLALESLRNRGAKA